MGDRTDAHMRNSDAFAWYMERDPALRSTIVSVQWLDRPPDWKVLVDRMDRVSRTVPGFRQKIVEPPLRLATPRWTVDPDFDLSWHLRRVDAPKPHTRDTVLEIAREAAMDAFDPDRPLWELTVVEGLKGGEAAAVMKVHHSLTDGVGGMQLALLVFDLQREPADLGELPPEPVGERLDTMGLFTDALATTLEKAARIVRHEARAALPSALHAVRHPGETLQRTVAMAGSVWRTVKPLSETLSPVMQERATTRRLATMEFPLTALKQAATTVDGTINDAFMAGVTGGLRRYHERHEASVDSLRVTVPISIRKEDDPIGGNRITLQRLTVPVGVADAASRMRLIHSVCHAARHEPSLPVTDTIAAGLNLLPPAYVGGILKHVDFLASNVPSFAYPLYIGGAEMTGYFAFGPTIGASVNVTLMSYRGTCCLGVNIDTAAIPDPDVLLDCLREGFAEVASVGASDVVLAG